MIANGTAPKIQQSKEGATYDIALFKPETHVVCFNIMYSFPVSPLTNFQLPICRLIGPKME